MSYCYNLYTGDDMIRDATHHTMRMGNINKIIPMKNQHKIQNPLLSQIRLGEGYATDAIFYKVTSFEG